MGDWAGEAGASKGPMSPRGVRASTMAFVHRMRTGRDRGTDEETVGEGGGGRKKRQGGRGRGGSKDQGGELSEVEGEMRQERRAGVRQGDGANRL